MTQLLSNAFELPPDGWYQISALGEFPHNPTGACVDLATSQRITATAARSDAKE